MNTSIFVLMMIIGGSTPQSGLATISQEFTSFENCEKARIEMEKSYPKDTGSTFNQNVLVRVSKCLPK